MRKSTDVPEQDKMEISYRSGRHVFQVRVPKGLVVPIDIEDDWSTCMRQLLCRPCPDRLARAPSMDLNIYTFYKEEEEEEEK